MPFNNQFSYEQTVVVRTAVSLVFNQIDDSHSAKRRQEVASVILKLASENQCDADALALAAMNHLSSLAEGTEPPTIKTSRGTALNGVRTAPITPVLIVSYRTPLDVVRCIASLDALAKEQPFEIYICENGGPAAWDALCLALDDFGGVRKVKPTSRPTLSANFSRLACFRFGNSGQHVFVGEAPDNLGYAGGINRWMLPLFEDPNWSGCWILNPDAVAEPGALVALIAEAEERKLGMVGSRVMWTPTDPRVRCRGLKWRRGLADVGAVDFGVTEFVKPNPETIEARIDAPSGVSVYFTRACAQALAPLDEKYFLYFEDLDWGMRARQAGFRIGYAHHSVVNHVGGASLGSPSPTHVGSPLALHLEFRNRILFTRDHYYVWWPWTVWMSLLHAVRLLPRGGFLPALTGIASGVRGETGRPDRLISHHQLPPSSIDRSVQA